MLELANVFTETVVVTGYEIDPGPSIIGSLIGYVIFVAATWPMVAKAGYPGWGMLIPIYNIYLLVKVGGFHGALTLLFFVPVANLIMSIILAFGIGKHFGKSGVFSFFLLWLFSIIGYFILSYGSAKHDPNAV